VLPRHHFDGTLVDSIHLIIESYHHTRRGHGLPAHPNAFWIAGLGTPLHVQFRRFTDDEKEVQRLIATYRAWNLAHHDAMVAVYPGALEAVRTLKARVTRPRARRPTARPWIRWSYSRGGSRTSRIGGR